MDANSPRADAENSARQSCCSVRRDDHILLLKPFTEGLRPPGRLREGIKPRHNCQIDEAPLQERLVIGTVTGSHAHLRSLLLQCIQVPIRQQGEPQKKDDRSGLWMLLNYVEELLSRDSSSGGHHRHGIHGDLFDVNRHLCIFSRRCLERLDLSCQRGHFEFAAILSDDNNLALVTNQLDGFLSRHRSQRLVWAQFDFRFPPGENEKTRSTENPQNGDGAEDGLPVHVAVLPSGRSRFPKPLRQNRRPRCPIIYSRSQSQRGSYFPLPPNQGAPVAVLPASSFPGKY